MQIGATNDAVSPIRAARERAGWTQITLSLRAGVSLSTERLAERGLATTRTLARIARALGVPLEDLRPRLEGRAP